MTRLFLASSLFAALLAAGCASTPRAEPASADVASTPPSGATPVPESATAALAVLETGPTSDTIRQRVEQALARPDVDRGFDQLIERVLANPQVSQGGERLLGELAADPVLAQSFSAILSDIGEHPAMTQLVMQMMSKDPSLTPDQVGEKVGAHVEQAMTPVMESAMTAPSIKRAIGQLDGKVSNSPHIKRAFATVISGPTLVAKWNTRLRELNGGVAPDETRAAELMIDRMFTGDRIARFYIAVTAHPVVTRRITALVRGALDAPTFRAHATQALRALVADPAFRPQVLALVGILLEPADPATAAQRTSRASAVLDRAHVPAAIAGFLDATINDPELGTLGDRALAELVSDSSVTSLLDLMLEGD